MASSAGVRIPSSPSADRLIPRLLSAAEDRLMRLLKIPTAFTFIAVSAFSVTIADAGQPFRERSEHCTDWDEERALCRECKIPLGSVAGSERSKAKELACSSMLPGEDVEISIVGNISVVGAGDSADSWIEVLLTSNDETATWANLPNVGNCPCSGSAGQRQIARGTLELTSVVPNDGIARASVAFAKCSCAKTDKPISTCRFSKAALVIKAGLKR